MTGFEGPTCDFTPCPGEAEFYVTAANDFWERVWFACRAHVLEFCGRPDAEVVNLQTDYFVPISELRRHKHGEEL